MAKKQRKALTRERIARVGLELADREGVDVFSMRRLADELGAGTMTLYGHFADKRELLDAVIDAAVAERDLPRLTGPWRARARQLIGYTRELFDRHPSVVEIWSRQPVLGGGSLHWVEAGLGVLSEAGFDDEEAATAFRLLVTYTYGFALFSSNRSDPGARDKARFALQSLPADRFPHLTRSAGAFAGAMGGDDAFDYGLERILDGLEQSLRSQSRG